MNPYPCPSIHCIKINCHCYERRKICDDHDDGDDEDNDDEDNDVNGEMREATEKKGQNMLLVLFLFLWLPLKTANCV